MADALVVGSAPGVWAEVREALLRLTDPIAMIAVNRAVLDLETVDHAVSHHAEALVHLVAYRRLRKTLPPATIAVHSSEAAPGVDHVWPDLKEGDSGLLAARIALALGFDRVVLAGIRIDGTGHVDGDPTRPFNYSIYRPTWKQRLHELRGRVFSMGGWTQQHLGGLA